MLLKSISERSDPELADVLDDHARAISDLHRLIQSLIHGGQIAGCYIGTAHGIIPAATDDNTPGVGMMMVRQVYGEYSLRDSGFLVRTLNIAKGSLGPIADGKQIATIPILNKPGHQLVILDPCDS
jgi:hypothetical protein